MERELKNNIVKGIITYIFANQPVSHEQLHERAKTKDWYTPDLFDTIMVAVGKSPDVSALTRDDLTIVYRRTVHRKRKNAWIPNLPPYPNPDQDYDKCPFKICFCLMYRTDGKEIWKKGMQHLPTCDAVRFPEEYRKQHGILYE